MPPPRHPVLCSVRLINEQGGGGEEKSDGRASSASVLEGRFYPPPCRSFSFDEGEEKWVLAICKAYLRFISSFRKTRREYISGENYSIAPLTM